MKKSLIFFMCVLFVNVSQAKAVDVYELLDKADNLYRGKTSYAEIDMLIETENWQRTLKLKAWSEGLEKTFISILAPKKDRGISTLKIKNEMWNYFPKINKVIKVPPSMMMGSWMGSDFTNDDFVKETTLKDDYVATLVTGDPNLYTIDLAPKKATVTVWGKIRVYILKKSSLLTKQEFFDEKGRLSRTIEFTDIKPMGGHTIPTKLTVRSERKKQRSTVLIYRSIKFNAPIPAATFTRKNLQKRR